MAVEQRVAMVTGGAAGIGEATCRRLAEDDYALVVADTARDAAERLAAELPTAIAAECDVTCEDDVAAAVRQAIDAFGRLDLVVNNAGIGSTKDVEHEDLEHFNRALAVCTVGTFLCCKHAAPHLREVKGCVVNVASIVATVGQRNRVAYAAAKGGVLSMTKAMAVDFVESGVRVNAVCPGAVDTPWARRLFDATDDAQATRGSVEARIPLKRLASPVEIADAITYLGSPAAAYITGTAMVVDGGLTA